MVVPERLDVHYVIYAIAAAQIATEHRREHVAVGECRLGPAAPPGGGVEHGALNKLKIEKSHPKGLMMSDFSCIFAMSLTQIYFFVTLI